MAWRRPVSRLKPPCSPPASRRHDRPADDLPYGSRLLPEVVAESEFDLMIVEPPILRQRLGVGMSGLRRGGELVAQIDRSVGAEPIADAGHQGVCELGFGSDILGGDAVGGEFGPIARIEETDAGSQIRCESGIGAEIDI